MWALSYSISFNIVYCLLLSPFNFMQQQHITYAYNTVKTLLLVIIRMSLFDYSIHLQR